MAFLHSSVLAALALGFLKGLLAECEADAGDSTAFVQVGKRATGDVGSPSAQSNSSVKQVVFIQDACLDDFLAIAALARAHKNGDIVWLADIVVNADSVLPQSMDMTYQFHQALGVSDVPVSISKSRLFNGFPWTYRNDTWSMSQLDSIKELANQFNVIWTTYEQYPDGDEFLKSLLMNATEGSITILTVATQTILEPIFKETPKLQKKVKEMVWMAGAVNVPGNTENNMYGHGYSGMNHYAEWNVYGDAFAAQYVMSTAPYPIYLVPLDVCDKIPVCRTDCDAYPDESCTSDLLSCNFIKIMNRSIPGLPQDCPTPLVYQALAEAYEKFAAPAPFYRLWDSAATAYVLKPELFLDEGMTDLATITDWTYEGWLAQPGEAENKGLTPGKFKSVNVFFNLTAPLQETRNKLYEFLATAACGSPYPPV